MMNNETTIPDAETRRLAETTFDQNVVVVAGAGTGKTTLLVNRFVHALMRQPDPVEVTRVVALTFTNKAATEMKVRLRERLVALTERRQEERHHVPGMVRADDLRGRYGLSHDAIEALARRALGDLEKAQIGTLHSFAAHVLRLYPMEGGVDPAFREDDGSRFQEYFSAQWELWLDRELGPDGPNAPMWRDVLRVTALESVRDVASALCSELLPLGELTRQTGTDEPGPALREWLIAAREQAAAMLAAHPIARNPRNVERALEAAVHILSLLLEHGLQGLKALDEATVAALRKDPGRCPRGWEEMVFTDAKRVIHMAQRVCAVDQGFWRMLLQLLTPFVEHVRGTFVQQGWLSFDGLLARARALLTEHPIIRERLKAQYQAILVDEFQDTDPVQYELVLYLAERPARCATSWQDVSLQPGKLFVVGDPKQSIYAFRRADIEAFERVVERIRLSGGAVYDLMTNFRSHGKVLEAVNAIFDGLFLPQPNLQPPNVPLQVRPDRRAGGTSTGVELRWVTSTGEEAPDADTARRLEAEQLAAWLDEDVLGKERLTDDRGQVMPVKPGHVALLFRKLTQAQDYLDALRRHGIQYVTDGEKHFYRRQEVIDLVNLLRVLDDPQDMVALLGVLRSPLGGLTDREIYDLRERGAFDVRAVERLQGWASPRAPLVRQLYECLTELARESRRRPLPQMVDGIFDRLPIRELAAASLHGEQALANLWKVRRMAADLADRPHVTMSGFVDLMIARLDEQPEESEGALAEESLEAVRVLTIHKAKGLEFPIVIVPGLHQGERGGTRDPIVSQDWSTGMLGLTIGGKQTLGAVLVGEKARAREEAEHRRLFYVAMTRAKERVVLSGGLVERRMSGTLFELLEEAAGTEVGDAAQATVSVGPVELAQTIIRAADRVPRRKAAPLVASQPVPAVADLLTRWEERDGAWEAARNQRVTVTPTNLVKEALIVERQPGSALDEPERARLVGTLAHRVLEKWDFQEDPAGMTALIDAVCGGRMERELTEVTEEVRADLQALMASFASSPCYDDLCRAEILGREVPFAISWVDGCVMHGALDLVYRLDGHLWVADYKTDRVAAGELPARVAHYRPQAEAYREAVSRSLGGQPVGFKFIFLRSGQAVGI